LKVSSRRESEARHREAANEEEARNFQVLVALAHRRRWDFTVKSAFGAGFQLNCWQKDNEKRLWSALREVLGL
jgi:hypothetical protein